VYNFKQLGVLMSLDNSANKTLTEIYEPLIKIDEVARMLHVSKVTIFAWKKAGKIPFYRLSDRIYFKRSEILASLEKNEKHN
jgi:excisionase family DNA binding protein